MRPHPLVVLAALLGGAALVWIAPLMLDQFVLFADRDQSARAAASRPLMGVPGAMLVAAALLLLAASRPWHALFAASPAIVAISLAWLMPDALFQLLAYAITAPLSIGALLAAAAPLPDRVTKPVLAGGTVVLVALTFLGAPFLALMGFLALFVWWRMPEQGPPSLTRPGWR